MKFEQRISIRDKMRSFDFSRAVWNPTRREWRDVIESLLTISRKHIDNKLAMFKLQLWISWDIINESEIIIKYKETLKKIKQDKKDGKIDEEQYKYNMENIRIEIESSRLTIFALREIIDGIVWRYFNYNRAILYILADKQPLDLVRGDKGFINSLYELAGVFVEKDSKAILNDISNFLRIGDVTSIKEDGTIEFVEVKSSKQRGRRISRQKQRMQETVEFFNTGILELDGKKQVITESKIKQRNYLKQLKDCILRAKNKGYDSVLLGSHLIVEVVDFDIMPEYEKVIEYFESKHNSVKNKWEKNKDFVLPGWFIQKFDYVRNYVPYTIFPFEDDICADILSGKIWIKYFLNNSEVIRIFEKSGWEVVDSLFSKSEEELKNTDIKDLYLYIVRKGEFNITIPSPWLGRLSFEMLVPTAIVEELEHMYSLGPKGGHDMFITNFEDDKKIWH